jgi:uncharacterized protein YggE
MFNKKIFRIGLLFVIAAVVLSACGPVASAAAQQAQENNPQVRTLSVTGNGQVFVSPDIARISIGVRTESQDAAEAVAQNNQQSQKVVQALMDMGIADQDIRTNNFSIYPQQDVNDQGQVQQTRYIVENSVLVTIRDLDTVGQALDAAVAAGANTVNSIQFDLEDRTDALQEARKQAVADAQAQAQGLAQSAGVTLGEIQTVNATSSGGPMPLFNARGGAAAVESSVPINPGQMSLSVEVNLVYQIK